MQHTKSQIVKTQRIRVVGICLSGLFPCAHGLPNHEQFTAAGDRESARPAAASGFRRRSAKRTLLRHGHRTSEEWGDDAAGTHRSVWWIAR